MPNLLRLFAQTSRILTVLLVLLVVSVHAQVLLQNPSFEQDGADRINPPAGWNRWVTTGQIAGTVAATSYPAFPLTMLDYRYAAGTAANNARYEGGFFQQVPVTPGHRYHCTVYLNTPVSSGTRGSGRLGVDLSGGTNPAGSSILWTAWTQTTEWRQIGFTFESAVVATGPVLTVFLHLRQTSTPPWSAVLFDYAALYDVSPIDLPVEYIWGWVAPGGRYGDDRGPADVVKRANELWYDTQEGDGHAGGWQQCEPSPGQFDWTAMDADSRKRAAVAAKGSVLSSYLAFGGTSWSPSFGTALYWFYAERFVTEMAKRANQWGTWAWVFENEPEGRNDVAGHGARLKHAYCALKMAHRNNIVIAPNISGTSTSQYNELYDQYSLRYSTDVIGSHQYSGDPNMGVNIYGADALAALMRSKGDTGKRIWLGEGWAPYAALGNVFRPNHHVGYNAREVDAVRRSLVNGFRHMATNDLLPGRDPHVLWGAAFFTMNDWYNKYGWRARAVPVDENNDGRVDYYTVDGYNVGLDIDPGFNPTGLCDFRGNSKDDIMDVFPGRHLSLANPGFELEWSIDRPYAWEPAHDPAESGTFLIDRSVYRHGRQSLRVERHTFGTSLVSQRSVYHSVQPGNVYTASARCRTWAVAADQGAGAALRVRFFDKAGKVLGNPVWSAGASYLNETWQPLVVSATAPAAADLLELAIGLDRAVGRAWFDDVTVNAGASIESATVRGVVVDDLYRPLAGATVVIEGSTCTAVTDASGEYVMGNVPPATYDLRAFRAGYAHERATRQIAPAGRTRVTSFVLQQFDARRPTNFRVMDPRTGTTLELAWSNPTHPAFQYVRVYGADIPSQPGTLLADGVTGESLVLTDLETGRRLYLSLEAVHGDIGASSRTEVELGRPSYGEASVFYQVGGEAAWSPPFYESDWGQTFVARARYDLASVSCMIGTGGAGSRQIQVSVHLGGPGGPQLGRTLTDLLPSSETRRFAWRPGEIPLQEGQTYYVRFRSINGGYGMYRNPTNPYAQGQMYLNGQPQPSYDIWGTFEGAYPPQVVIRDVTAEMTGSSTAQVRWTTDLPATSMVEYGLTSAYGLAVPEDSLETKQHSITLQNLPPDSVIHFRVRSTWQDLASETSADYLLRTGPQAATPSPVATWTRTPTHTPTVTRTPTHTPIPGSNLLVNPGAETGDLQGWTQIGAPADQPTIDPPVSVPVPPAHSGNHRFGILVEGETAWVSQQQVVHVWPGRLYEAGLWLSKPAGAGTRVHVLWVENAASRTLLEIGIDTTHSDWRLYVCAPFIPSQPVGTFVVEYAKPLPEGVAVVHVDDIFLREVVSPLPTPTGTPWPTGVPTPVVGDGVLSLY